MTNSETAIISLERELSVCKRECAELQEKLQESRKTVRKEALIRLRNARTVYNAAFQAHEEADDLRDACRAELCSCVIGQRDPVEVHREVKSDTLRAYELKKISGRRIGQWPAVVLFLLAVLTAVLGAISLPHVFILTGLFAVGGIGLVLWNNKLVAEAQEARKERNAILAKYKAEDEDGIACREAEFVELDRRFTEAEEREHRTAEIAEQLRTGLEALETRTLEDLDFSSGEGEAAVLTRSYNEKLQRCRELEAELESLRSTI